MDSIFRGAIETRRGRALAWVDALFIDHAIFRLGWTNFAAVVPGRLYRSNHPLPFHLTARARRLGLKTVLNLRGATGNGSDALSRERAARLGLDFVDLPIQSKHPPSRADILRLAAAFRVMAEPALIHCKSGADRAGFAAGLFLLCQGADTATALRQLSWRHGHIASARTGVLDAFFLLFRRQGEGRTPFLDWVRNEYDPAALTRDYKAHGLANFVNDRVLARE